LLETINWLALTFPFIAAGAAFVSLQERQQSKLLATCVAVVILAAAFVGYSYMYHAVGFPLWMRWLS